MRRHSPASPRHVLGFKGLPNSLKNGKSNLWFYNFLSVQEEFQLDIKLLVSIVTDSIPGVLVKNPTLMGLQNQRPMMSFLLCSNVRGTQTVPSSTADCKRGVGPIV